MSYLTRLHLVDVKIKAECREEVEQQVCGRVEDTANALGFFIDTVAVDSEGWLRFRYNEDDSDGYDPDDEGPDDEALEVLFPHEKNFTQRELVDAGAKGLYDQVQTDSDVERRFVSNIKDEGALVFYFKFPATFKVPLPKQIGNYNPDWGLARLDEKNTTIHYIRETKGSTRIETLRFPAEIRKIKCAQKYFEALELDYRPIDDTVGDWWTPWVTTAELPS